MSMPPIVLGICGDNGGRHWISTAEGDPNRKTVAICGKGHTRTFEGWRTSGYGDYARNQERRENGETPRNPPGQMCETCKERVAMLGQSAPEPF